MSGESGIAKIGGHEMESEIEAEEVDVAVVRRSEIDGAVLAFSVALDVDLFGFEVNAVIFGVLG